jgi:hypothetical protein
MSEKINPTGESLIDAEARATDLLSPLLKPHLSYLSGVYDLIVRLNTTFHERLLRDMDQRLLVSLLLLGRVGNDLRAIILVSERGYGGQACALAANVFELAWQITWITDDSKEAARWAKASHLTQHGTKWINAISRYLNLNHHPKPHEQLAVERKVYARISAVKHGNPTTLDLRPMEEWEIEGSLRLGPDSSAFGQKVISLAVTVAGQVVELALNEVAIKHVPSALRSAFLFDLGQSTIARRRLIETANSRWSGFP